MVCLLLSVNQRLVTDPQGVDIPDPKGYNLSPLIVSAG